MSEIQDIVEGTKPYPIKRKELYVPLLDEILPYIRMELEKHFKHVLVYIEEKDDLSPYGLDAKGLGGTCKLIEGGGEPFNHDPLYYDQVYFDMGRMCKQVGMDNALVIGAAAASAKSIAGHLGELIPCLSLGSWNSTQAARVGEQREAIIQSDTSLLCGGISNLFVCEGKPVPAVHFRVSGRIGPQPSLPQILRAALARYPQCSPDRQMGMGGVFKMTQGKVKGHINPDRECLPENYYDTQQMKCVKDFLQFYSMDGPLLCFSTLWTGEPAAGSVNLNLRPSGEHTHYWGLKDDGSVDSERGGHYHGDTTPEQVEYEGCFNFAAEIVRLWDAVQQKEDDS